MSKLDPDDARSPYEQLADALRESIRAGHFGPGAQLPSYNALAAEYGVAPNTVKSALATLRSEGLIVSRPGKGSFVRTRPAPTSGGAGDGRTLADVWEALEATNRRLDELERRIEGHRVRSEA
jgi:DNA-binding GntR family transcriptional regulator